MNLNFSQLFREQLHCDDNPELATLLGLDSQKVDPFQFVLDNFELSDNELEYLKERPASEIHQIIRENECSDAYDETNNVKKYDVFVFELCDGNISKDNKNGLCQTNSKKKKEFTLTQSIDVCKQLLEGLKQLEESDKCHNDLKPGNILFKTSEEKYENGDAKIVIKISDFGTAGRSGGTPGWTWPRFISKRQPGRSDMYSVASLILYVMCESRELFYRLRDNYIDSMELWLVKFRQDPLIELVIDMMSLKPSVDQCIQKWDEMADYVEILTEWNLCIDYRIPRHCFDIQDGMKRVEIANATVLDK